MENIYHRFLNIPYDPGINLNLKPAVPVINGASYSHVEIGVKEINPLLTEWLNNRNIGFIWPEAICTFPSGGKVKPHSDIPAIGSAAKINWTYGAPGSKMIWWKVQDHKNILEVNSSYGWPILFCDEEYCQKIYEQEISKPSLVEAGIFHSTYNPSNEKRWTLSLALYELGTKNRLTWGEAYNRLLSNVIE